MISQLFLKHYILCTLGSLEGKTIKFIVKKYFGGKKALFVWGQNPFLTPNKKKLFDPPKKC